MLPLAQVLPGHQIHRMRLAIGEDQAHPADGLPGEAAEEVAAGQEQVDGLRRLRVDRQRDALWVVWQRRGLGGDAAAPAQAEAHPTQDDIAYRRIHVTIGGAGVGDRLQRDGQRLS